MPTHYTHIHAECKRNERRPAFDFVDRVVNQKSERFPASVFSCVTSSRASAHRDRRQQSHRADLLTKPDGVIRKVVGARETTAAVAAVTTPTPSPGQNVISQPTASIKNPVAPTPDSIAAGKRAYDANCAACHGNLAQGASKAGLTISIVEE
jgi:hypothetical protein